MASAQSDFPIKSDESFDFCSNPNDPRLKVIQSYFNIWLTRRDAFKITGAMRGL